MIDGGPVVDVWCQSNQGHLRLHARPPSRSPSPPLVIGAAWRERIPPGEGGGGVVWHQQRRQSRVAIPVSAKLHEDLGGTLTGHDASLAVGMRAIPLGMGRDVQDPHTLMELVQRHSVLLRRRRSRLVGRILGSQRVPYATTYRPRPTRRSGLPTMALQKIPHGLFVPELPGLRAEAFRGQGKRIWKLRGFSVTVV